MAAAIGALSDETAWRQAGDEAHAQAAAAFNLQRVCEAWYGLLTTDLDPAVPDPGARAARLRLTGMYFTLAVSASTRERCAALISAAAGTDPRVMPIPGPPAVAWRAQSGLLAVVCWPASRRARSALACGHHLG